MGDGRRARTLIGWQGISVWVPSDWALAAVGGDEKSGYLRVDDQWMPRLQVKWSQGHVNLQRKRAEYARRLMWARRGLGALPGAPARWGKPTGLEVDLEARVLSHRSKPKKEIAGFAWRGKQCGMGVLWNCEVCGRSLIAQVNWVGSGRSSRSCPTVETAREVLASLEDHGTDGWRWWGLDGLSFLAPQQYQVQRHRRLSRYLEVQLGIGRRLRGRATWVKVARWGMVPLVLQGRAVGEWFKDQLGRVAGGRAGASRLRRSFGVRGSCPTEEMTVKGHLGVVAWGPIRRWGGGEGRRLARRPSGGLGRVAGGTRPGETVYGACAWHCPEANRLYLVETVAADQGELLKGVVESIVCHQSGAGEG